MLRARFAAALMVTALAVSPAPVFACDVAGLSFSPKDTARLNSLEASRTRGLVGALRSESAPDRSLVADIYGAGFATAGDQLTLGKYQCRTIKLGGALSLIAYQWFQCEIGQEEDTYTLRKITGSQNFFGTLTPTPSGFTYRGAAHYGYEPEVRFYGQDPGRDQVGCLNKIDATGTHLALELPMPVFESDHDVIELRAIGR